ncbi:MAG TPA: SPOR domain-containing protein [Candidatus Binatia bacterium]|jgi:cell division septation protein DedD
MAENRRGKENRFYFSRGQMVLLGAAFTVASVIIFFLGMFVGKGIEERRLVKKEEPLVKIPVKPGAQEPSTGATPTAHDEITFNDPLPSPIRTPEAAAEEKPRQAKRTEPLNIAETKEKNPPPASPIIPVKPAEKKTEKAALTQTTAKKSERTNLESQEAQKNWRAQVNAYPDERSAKLVADRLKNKGYNAYVSEVQNQGKTWYRVSVGRYGSRDEADKTLEALRNKENFPKAFVTSK